MISDSSGVIDLLLGAERRIMQDGDAQIVVPATVQPIVNNIKPTQPMDPATQSAQIQTTSFFCESFVSRNNQAALNSVVATLAKGLWEIEFTLSTWSDTNNTAGAQNTCAIFLAWTVPVAVVTLIARIWAIGSFTDTHRVRVLMRDTFQIKQFVSATAVAVHIDTLLTVNAIRLL